MIDKKIHVAIKSYKRAGKVKTINVFPFGKIWIPESQEEDYLQFYAPDQLIVIPDDLDGSICRKNNTILDRSPSEWTLILNDDITAIGCWDGGEHFYLSPEEVEYLICQGFIMADDLGVEFWGINQGNDALWYRTYQPFCLLAPVLGPFHGHLSPTIRYDESVLGKDDYDYWLLNIRKHRKTLRFNKYHYLHDLGTMPGGFVSMRSLGVEEAGILRMREKWGDSVFREGGSAGGARASGKNILNSRVRIPIPGC